jgi:hypothetical protein
MSDDKLKSPAQPPPLVNPVRSTSYDIPGTPLKVTVNDRTQPDITRTNPSELAGSPPFGPKPKGGK